MSDRIAVMRAGRVLQVGTPIDIYERPADLFVASFVGKANFLEGTLRSMDGGRGIVETAVGTIEGSVVGEIAIGAAVQLMIRPENLRIRAGATSAPLAIIKQASYLGYGTEYLLQSDGQLFRSLELRHRSSIPLPEGTRVGCEWSWDEALVFPVEA